MTAFWSLSYTTVIMLAAIYCEVCNPTQGTGPYTVAYALTCISLATIWLHIAAIDPP